jgi:hypothetical protein
MLLRDHPGLEGPCPPILSLTTLPFYDILVHTVLTFRNHGVLALELG